jgi:two-component system, NarL family, sensor histidine kinase UhpB
LVLATQKLGGITERGTSGLLIAGVALAALAAVVGLAVDAAWLALAGLAAAIVLAAVLAYHLLQSERERHAVVEAERARLSDQLMTAEQEERRRLALFLHDVPVQAMSGIALMLDGVLDAIERGTPEDAKRVLTMALERQRETIRELRDLSFALEPVVLRDQGFGPAVQALADQVARSHRVQFDLDVAEGEALAERAQVALYQIIREAVDQAVRRGPPARISVRIVAQDGGGVETVIVDDSPGERRRRSFDALDERARTLQGRVAVETSPDGEGTAVRVTLPPYTAHR